MEVYSGISNDIWTWLCAARLYISSTSNVGYFLIIFVIMLVRDDPSLMSPYSRLSRSLIWSMRVCEYSSDVRRTIPYTSYPLSSRSSAKYDPSWPVIPVTNEIRIYNIMWVSFYIVYIANVLKSESTGLGR